MEKSLVCLDVERWVLINIAKALDNFSCIFIDLYVDFGCWHQSLIIIAFGM